MKSEHEDWKSRTPLAHPLLPWHLAPSLALTLLLALLLATGAIDVDVDKSELIGGLVGGTAIGIVAFFLAYVATWVDQRHFTPPYFASSIRGAARLRFVLVPFVFCFRVWLLSGVEAICCYTIGVALLLRYVDGVNPVAAITILASMVVAAVIAHLWMAIKSGLLNDPYARQVA